MKWAIRDLLNPVATRSLLYGADPFDLEYILKKIDSIKVKQFDYYHVALENLILDLLKI